jgi:CRP/FNR family transcriptional regulator
MVGLGKLVRQSPSRACNSCADCTIRHRGICAYCKPDEFKLLDAVKFYRDFAPGQEIFAAGEETDFLGSVIDGVISLSKMLPDGRRQTVGLMFPSDFVGRPMRRVAPYDAVALTPVRLCLFARSRFEQILRGSPELEKRLLEMTLDELDAAMNSMPLVTGWFFLDASRLRRGLLPFCPSLRCALWQWRARLLKMGLLSSCH